jgi:SAM-dependent methyltransferase
MSSTGDTRIERALAGEILYGDDFSEDELLQWYSDEREAYFTLSQASADRPPQDVYEYAGLADRHGFRLLPQRFEHVLGVGSGNGAELQPILDRTARLTVLEPSAGFAATKLKGKPVEYVKPAASNLMPFPAATFDLIVCMAALHHVANVSTVIQEMARVLKPGGYVILREPAVSMGDWRYPRAGLTKRERGIPVPLFRKFIAQARLRIVHERRCMFALLPRVAQPFLRKPVWTVGWVVRADELVCRLPWPRIYHAKHAWQKLRAVAVAYVLQKPGALPG